jgi:hypothetical protein
MVRVKSDVVARYNEMIFEERKKFLKFKDKMALSKLKLDYLLEEKELIREKIK